MRIKRTPRALAHPSTPPTLGTHGNDSICGTTTTADAPR